MEDETIGITKVQTCRCLVLEERVLKAEENYTDLESELQKRRKEYESLELRFKEIESEKLVVEQELRNLKESVEDPLFDQMMVNRALEVEKHAAEKEAEDWKRKFEKLAYKEDLSSEGLAYHKVSGSPFITTPVKDYMPGRNRANLSSPRRRVKKRLVFEDDDGHKLTDVSDSETEERIEKESDGKVTSDEKSVGESYEDEDVEACEANTSTSPPGRKRKRVITSDSENDDDEEDRIPISTFIKNQKPPSPDGSGLVDATSGGENESGGLRIQRRVSSRLRKQRVLEEVSTPTERLVGIPTTGGNAEDDDDDDDDDDETEEESESESLDGFIVDDDDDDDEDDNITKNLKPPKQEMLDLADSPTTEENGSKAMRRQRRVSSRLRKQKGLEESTTPPSEGKSTERLVGIPKAGNAEEDETEEDWERESESESLDGFIVDDETASEKSDETEGDAREQESYGEETGYADVISRLRRDKNPESREWEYEADMLAAFGKDPELCMRAVCDLYMLQTEDEKATRSSHVANGIGFSKFDAERGTRIGRFLTDGGVDGYLKKSVDELERFEFNGVEICRDLACKYSKQLFKMYKKPSP